VNRTTVLVADGLALFRTGVSNLLLRESDFHVIEAGTLGELRRQMAEERPDIALIALDLPPSGGLEAVSALAEGGETVLLVWSFNPSQGDVLSAVQAGADGYLHKEISPQGLIRALRGIAGGEAPLARDLAALMIDALHGIEERAVARERAATLSAREREVLALLAGGARNRQIADELLISEFTVKRHVQNILQKLDLTSRHSAARFYRTAYDTDGLRSTLSRTA
jgi:two-component system, NarL family, nitrate/nitrite response regulator NarL